MDGRAWTVGELAHHAGIARNTASGHVRRLVNAGLLVEYRQGRHCYLTLAGPRVAAAVEAMSLASRTHPATSSLRGHRHDEELAAGRTCYRHLAGRLGVDLLDRWTAAELVTDAWELTDAGRASFSGLGVDIRPDPRRDLLRPCIDWTQAASARRRGPGRPVQCRRLRARLGRPWLASPVSTPHPCGRAHVAPDGREDTPVAAGGAPGCGTRPTMTPSGPRAAPAPVRGVPGRRPKQTL